jgi:hypothetical protein
MKKHIAVLTVILGVLFLLTGIAISSEQTTVSPDTLLGKYEGRILIMYRRPIEHNYSVDITKIDSKNGQVFLHTYCLECKPTELNLKCELNKEKMPLSFICKGEGWHMDYELDGDSLKANCLAKAGYMYYIKVNKVVDKPK